jgi:mannose-6-phosphate isomerase-like protein (cupin superfamily)
MKIFELEQLLKDSQTTGQRYFEFLRARDISLGIYELSAGAQDLQKPHKQDEVYYVLSGRAHIEVDGERQPVQSGSVIYVAKLAKHRFLDISEDLKLLVFFAPAEGD